MVRQAAPFRKLNGFEAGPVIHAPLYPDVAFRVVTSSCAAKGRRPPQQTEKAQQRSIAATGAGKQK